MIFFFIKYQRYFITMFVTSIIMTCEFRRLCCRHHHYQLWWLRLFTYVRVCVCVCVCVIKKVLGIVGLFLLFNCNFPELLLLVAVLFIVHNSLSLCWPVDCRLYVYYTDPLLFLVCLYLYISTFTSVYLATAFSLYRSYTDISILICHLFVAHLLLACTFLDTSTCSNPIRVCVCVCVCLCCRCTCRRNKNTQVAMCSMFWSGTQPIPCKRMYPGCW